MDPTAASATPTTRARRGDTDPEERARLRRTLGQHLYAQRLARGLTQATLAAAAGVWPSTISELENGSARPSDRSTRLIAAALHPRADALTVAVEDLRLRRLAGSSLYLYKRSRPPRVATQRLYERAAVVLDAEEREQQRAFGEAMVAAVGEAFGPPRSEPGVDDLWPGGRPQVRR